MTEHWQFLNFAPLFYGTTDVMKMRKRRRKIEGVFYRWSPKRSVAECYSLVIARGLLARPAICRRLVVKCSRLTVSCGPLEMIQPHRNLLILQPRSRVPKETGTAQYRL